MYILPVLVQEQSMRILALKITSGTAIAHEVVLSRRYAKRTKAYRYLYTLAKFLRIEIGLQLRECQKNLH